MTPFWEERCIYKVVCGSRAHGLASESSDEDTRGVCIPPRRCLLGLASFDQHESPGGDHVVYALAKFARLALQGNPNIIETLYTPCEHVIHIDAHGERLVAARALFLSKRVGERFMGYALDQLRRTQRHHRWLVDPPRAEPRPEAHGAWAEAGRYRFPDTAAERSYETELKRWHGYRRWREGRNPRRAELEARHGYDTKHAMHLCRLLLMGREILEEGVVRVRRPDRDWLLGIRAGAMSYEELLAWARSETERLPELTARSALPETPDAEAAEALVVDLQESYLFSDKPAGARRP